MASPEAYDRHSGEDFGGDFRAEIRSLRQRRKSGALGLRGLRASSDMVWIYAGAGKPGALIPLAGPLAACDALRGDQYDLINQSINQS